MKITLGELRSLLRESILVSADEFEKSASLDDEKDVALLEAMRKWDLQLIPSSKSDQGFLGRGASGRVYEVVKDGKHMVLKLTSDPSDARAYAKTQQLRQRVPEFIARALPKIYAQGKLNARHWALDQYYATLMEPLHPLHSKVKFDLWGMADRDDESESGITQTQVKNLSAPLVDELDDIVKQEFSNPEEVLSSSLYKEMKRKIGSGYFVPGFSFDSAFNDGELMIKNYLSNMSKLVSDEEAASFRKHVLNQWKELVKYRGARFPEHGSRGHLAREPSEITDKRARHLLIALRWLVKKGLLRAWDDLHSDNVMVRPSTGDYVVSDVGEFGF